MSADVIQGRLFDSATSSGVFAQWMSSQRDFSTALHWAHCTVGRPSTISWWRWDGAVQWRNGHSSRPPSVDEDRLYHWL